jgi:glycosyltransferase involved in cell wall biosynthesis
MRRAAVEGAPDIAIVVPCRNAAPWLPELFASIAAQTRAPAEVVIVDDGSTDDSRAIAEHWGSERHPFRITVLHQSAEGLYRAVARGFESTTAAMMVRVDADDVLHPAFLASLAEALESAPGAGYSYSAVRMFGDASGRYHTRPFSAPHLVLEGNFVCAAALMRREAYDEAGGVADLPAWEDWDLWLSFLDAGYEGVFVDEELYFWRRHGQTRNQLNWIDRRRLRLQIMRRHPRLVRRYLVRGLPLLARRVVNPVRQQ